MPKLEHFYKNYYKYRNKLFDCVQVEKMILEILEKEKADWKREQQLGVVLTVATILNAKPFGFGKKRLEDFFRLLFEQSSWINEHPEDATLIAETVKRTGLKFYFQKGNIALDIKSKE